MKKVLLVPIIIAVHVFTFCKTFSQTPVKTEKDKELKNKEKMDTVITRKKEISLTKKFDNSYQIDERVIAVMSLDFVKDIVSPMDTKKKLYKTQKNQGNAALDTVKAAVLKKVIADESWKKKRFKGSVGDVINLKVYNCSIIIGWGTIFHYKAMHRFFL